MDEAMPRIANLKSVRADIIKHQQQSGQTQVPEQKKPIADVPVAKQEPVKKVDGEIAVKKDTNVVQPNFFKKHMVTICIFAVIIISLILVVVYLNFKRQREKEREREEMEEYENERERLMDERQMRSHNMDRMGYQHRQHPRQQSRQQPNHISNRPSGRPHPANTKRLDPIQESPHEPQEKDRKMLKKRSVKQRASKPSVDELNKYANLEFPETETRQETRQETRAETRQEIDISEELSDDSNETNREQHNSTSDPILTQDQDQDDYSDTDESPLIDDTATRPVSVSTDQMVDSIMDDLADGVMADDDDLESKMREEFTENLKQDIDNVIMPKFKVIEQISKGGGAVIRRFTSEEDIFNSNFSLSSVIKCCDGKQQSHNKSYFRYAS